jgi:hypothetical protein
MAAALAQLGRLSQPSQQQQQQKSSQAQQEPQQVPGAQQHSLSQQQPGPVQAQQQQQQQQQCQLSEYQVVGREGGWLLWRQLLDLALHDPTLSTDKIRFGSEVHRQKVRQELQ